MFSYELRSVMSLSVTINVFLPPDLVLAGTEAASKTEGSVQGSVPSLFSSTFSFQSTTINILQEKKIQILNKLKECEDIIEICNEFIALRNQEIDVFAQERKRLKTLEELSQKIKVISENILKSLKSSTPNIAAVLEKHEIIGALINESLNIRNKLSLRKTVDEVDERLNELDISAKSLYEELNSTKTEKQALSNALENIEASIKEISTTN